MKYQTTYLLSASRMPEHFYSLIHGLQGRDVLYNNPGVSLRSFVVANILHEYLTLEPEMNDILNECIDFTDDESVYEKINHALRTQPYDILEKILEIGRQPSAVKDVMIRLNAMNKKVEETWDVLARNTLPGQKKNMWSSPASDYKQAIIDLKLYTTELAGHLDTLQERK